jgi:hypothetical protein
MQTNGQEHEIEPELRQLAPRPVRRRPGHPNVLGCLQIFLLPHLTVALFLPCYMIFLTALMVAGVESPGHVVSTQSYMSTGKSPHMVYNVRYAYDVRGLEHRNEDSVPAQKFAELQEGSAVTVRYLSDFPDLHPVLVGPGYDPYNEFPFLIFFALFWDGVVGFVAWGVYVLPVRNRKLVVSGKPTVGRITGKKMSVGSKSTTYTVSYEFLPERIGLQPPLPLTGKMAVSSNDYSSFHEGEHVTVLYRLDRPKANIVYKGSDFEAVR